MLQHATEGYRVADILAKKKIPVSLTLIDSPGGKAETMGLLEENAAILEKAGVTVAINTDDSITESRFYPAHRRDRGSRRDERGRGAARR